MNTRMKQMIYGGGLALGLVACTQATIPPVAQGQATYEQYCAQCHGAGGRGDGPLAGSLPGGRAPDLTGISAANGGTFPALDVMNQIDGYFREGNHASLMPEFGEILADGPTVILEGADGSETPTPALLADLAAYIETLQR
ncbi:Cytochrome c [Pseudoruegeria aquimaris]|uniref:Cytochrome c n=1 Tax=Pseudoruegeria aquimaris TaxID=393663 RepID=A0A1Y5TK86_9RHOB|nr:cytochrome c [Pseudoruegeria aquimaris]SLN66269.1 Cytochrome c [Pseudoruegeria aquimaris]